MHCTEQSRKTVSDVVLISTVSRLPVVSHLINALLSSMTFDLGLVYPTKMVYDGALCDKAIVLPRGDGQGRVCCCRSGLTGGH